MISRAGPAAGFPTRHPPTTEGEIAVEVHALSLHAELVVKDTGIGIPAHELPNLFKRFHRVRGARARTVEGAGIGLVQPERAGRVFCEL